MSRIGNPYDNAKAESFMKTLKQEEINGNSYRNLSQARGAIGAFIETIYNRASACIRHWLIARRRVRSNIGEIPGGDLTDRSLDRRELLLISCLTQGCTPDVAPMSQAAQIRG